MNRNHTSGPWVAEVRVNDHGGWQPPEQVVAISAGETLIAYYDTSSDEFPCDEVNEANARLIAAAPELLEALIEVRDNAKGDSLDMWERVDAAIAKAVQP